MSANLGSYSSKQLRTTLILPQSNFPGTASNTLTLVGYRALANIVAASTFPNALDLTIFGMRQADMNAVTILYLAATPQAVNARALVQLEASSDGVAWAQVFEGQFVQAQPDYQSLPDAHLKVLAVTGNGMQIQAVPPTSYRGATSIASIAAYLAGQMGFTLENNGVTGSLSTPYFPGTYMDQFRALCEHANLDFYFDGNATLAICPKNSPRQGKPVPVLSPSSGLVGIPTMGQFGPHIDALFQPAFTTGGLVQVAGSIAPGVNGTWAIGKMVHDLSSLVPDGPWFSHMDTFRPPGAPALP